MVVLDHGFVMESEAVVLASPQRTAYFSNRRRLGVVLRVSSTRARPWTCSTKRA